MSTDTTETVATYRDHRGRTVEIDHLGIGNPEQCGEYAVYRDAEQIAEFATPAAMFRDVPLVGTDELIESARHAVAETESA